MNQTVSTILIPFLLVSQSLFSVPHSHAGTSVNEPDGHAAKAHVHWSWGNHDADGESSPASDDEHEHDSDAVYAGDTQFLNDARTGKVSQPELSIDCFVFDSACIVEATTASSILRSRQPAPETLRPKCARYLQLLSIRC
ncbi:hypothetical protein HG15A2_25820 [Adhaeretor mobilis]|uniref:Uncharacterized protein n=1 Tax=Adhaeretor mobilis TaxID=1930276 RepID=A0A517MWK1_9BACT|nr:hypothetical protein HG15A2_25820 [Adhaeretor mobilis]